MVNVAGASQRESFHRRPLYRNIAAEKLKGWRRGLLLYGKPDFVFIKARIAVFIDGCFWHGCPLHGEIPATNRDRWRKKISGNCKRDKRVTKYLRFNGWHVFRIWEHDLGRARLNCKLENTTNFTIVSITPSRLTTFHFYRR